MQSKGCEVYQFGDEYAVASDRKLDLSRKKAGFFFPSSRTLGKGCVA